MKHVVVPNQFALPRNEGGRIRHVDLFGRPRGWTPTIIAGNRNHQGQASFTTADQHFRLVPVARSIRGALSRLGWLFCCVLAFARVLTTRPLHAVYGSSPHLIAPLAGLAAARLRRVPFVLEIRDLWPESIVAAGALSEGSLAHRALSRMEKLVVSHADHVVAVADGWGEHFSGLGLNPHADVTVVPDGTELSDFEVTQDGETLRDLKGLTSFTAVFAGAHGSKDGIDLVLAAAGQLPEIRLLLGGDGPTKQEAVARAARAGLTNVTFRGPVPKSHLAVLLMACDVGIHAVSPLSVFDKGMSPNKLFDYVAAGLPVVSNADTALRSVLADGKRGCVGPSDSLVNGPRAVFMADFAKRDEWGAAGPPKIASRFSRSAASADLESVLDAVVARHGQVPS
jgi:glycosyltransferase involved in cell wall biosynthesis